MSILESCKIENLQLCQLLGQRVTASQMIKDANERFDHVARARAEENLRAYCAFEFSRAQRELYAGTQWLESVDGELKRRCHLDKLKIVV